MAPGRKHGIWTTWDEEGNRVSEGEWVDGALVSPLRMWDGVPGFLPEPEALEKAKVGGRYRVLLAKIAAPEDRERYQDFRDFGHYRATDYKGHRDVHIWFVFTDDHPEKALAASEVAVESQAS